MTHSHLVSPSDLLAGYVTAELVGMARHQRATYQQVRCLAVDDVRPITSATSAAPSSPLLSMAARRYLQALDVRCAAIRSSVAQHLATSRQAALEASERAQAAVWADQRQAPRQRAVGTIPPVNLDKRGTHVTWTVAGAQYAPDKPRRTPAWRGSSRRTWNGLPAVRCFNGAGTMLVTRDPIEAEAARAAGRGNVLAACLLERLARLPIAGPFGLIETRRTILVAPGRAIDRQRARTTRRAIVRDARPVMAREGLSDQAAVKLAHAGSGSWHLVNGGTLTRSGFVITLTFADKPYERGLSRSTDALAMWVSRARKRWQAEHAEQAQRSTAAYASTLAHLPNVSALAD